MFKSIYKEYNQYVENGKMEHSDLIVLSKFKWYKDITNAYEYYLKSNNISEEKTRKLSVLFGWSIDYIYFNTYWETFYPDWRKDDKSGNPVKVTKSVSNKKSFLIKKEFFFIAKNLYIFKVSNLEYNY